MSDRLLKILAGILVFFVLAWVVARLLSGGGGERAPFDLTSAADLQPDSMVVVGPADTVRLLADDEWTVNGHAAVSDAGETLKSALEDAEVGQLVSRNPDNHGRLGVTPDSGHVLTLYAGGEAKLALIIGKRAELFDRAYVRRPDDVEVYTLQGNLVNLARRGVDDWRERQIVSAVRGDLQRIEYTYGDTSFALARDSAGWRVEPSRRAVAEGSVESVLNNLAELRALGFAADSIADTLSWESPTARVTVLGPDDARIAELDFIRREENVGYFVRRAGEPVVYTLSSYSGEQILKRRDQLAPPSEDMEPVPENQPVPPPDD